MAEIQNEGNPQAEGAGSQPVSSGEGKPFEGSQNELVELLKAQSKKLETFEKEIRGLQSKQDKGDKQFKEFMADYQKQVAAGVPDHEAYEIAQNNQNAKKRQAEREALLDQLLAERSGKSVGADSKLAKAKELALKYGIDENDPSLAEIVSTKDEDRWEGEIAIRAIKKTSPQSLGGVPSMPATPSPSKPDLQRLGEEYVNKVLEAKGNKMLVRQLREEYRKKGVPVDNTVFSV